VRGSEETWPRFSVRQHCPSTSSVSFSNPAELADRSVRCSLTSADPAWSSSVKSHVVSPRLTSPVPQPRHTHPEWLQTPWSHRFDRIFRNEGATGSNPVSSTDFVLYLLAKYPRPTPAPGGISDPRVSSRSTGVPQDRSSEHLIFYEVLSHSISHRSTSKELPLRRGTATTRNGGLAPQS
jgi:hypothetical protein